MKKGWKVFWVLCISLSIFGIALCVSGILLGATTERMREVFGMRRMEIMESSEDASDSYASDPVENFEERASSESGILSQEARDFQNSGEERFFSDIEELKIDVTCLEVEILERSGSEIYLDTRDISDEIREDLVITQKDEKLNIELKNKSKWDKLANHDWNDSKGTLFIQIPAERRFKEASMKVGAGVLTADNLHAEELDIDVGAGQVYLDSFIVKELELECGAGEANLYGEVEREAKIECGIGSVSYTAAGRQEDYDYEVSCGIGSVNVGDDSYSGLGGERKIKNGGSKKMEIECGIGMVDVSFED